MTEGRYRAEGPQAQFEPGSRGRLLIHPFREDNGRCARLLGWLMALQAGWPPLDFSPLSGRGKAAYFAAVQTALTRDYAPLEGCFRRVLARTSRACASSV